MGLEQTEQQLRSLSQLEGRAQPSKGDFIEAVKVASDAVRLAQRYADVLAWIENNTPDGIQLVARAFAGGRK